MGYLPLAVTACLLLASSLAHEEIADDPCSATMTPMQLQLMKESDCAGTDGPCVTDGCCPKIVKPTAGQPGGTQIVDLSGCRAVVEALVQPGSCPTTIPFMYEVDWGDGMTTKNTTKALQPFQVVHTYGSCPKTYLVKIVYCPSGVTTPCCDTYCKSINVS